MGSSLVVVSKMKESNPLSDLGLKVVPVVDEEKERMRVLLTAMCEILEKLEDSRFVLSFFDQTAVWDGVECDGGCLFTEAKELLNLEGDNNV